MGVVRLDGQDDPGDEASRGDCDEQGQQALPPVA